MTRFIARIAGRLGAVVLGVLIASSVAQPAGAALLTAGEASVLNFDFTGQPTPPPYTALMSFGIGFTDVSNDSTTEFDIFGGLNGTGALLDTMSVPFAIAGLGWGSADPQALDGIFSIEVKVLTGSLAIAGGVSSELNTDPCGCGASAVAEVAGTIGTLAVPEPASLALFVTGLLGPAWPRRGKRV